VIGIETHVQLDTNTKAFCACKSSYGDVPNTNVCPICLGHPGMMPSLNKRVVELAIKTALALRCSVHTQSKFDRKQYFYGDLPKGYQISQNDQPIATDGNVQVPMFVVGTKMEEEQFPSCHVRIHRLHIEEDTAKLTHQGADSLALDSSSTLADYNRAGVPLVEIVTEPDMRTGEQAAAYAQELRRIVRFLGVSSGNMQEGSLRCDVNISVRRKGTEALGTKVEVKNLNSFSAVRAAAEYELKRQSKLMEEGRGDEIVQETRLWDENRSKTQSMRTKEGAADYRYFREPDLPFLVLPNGMVDKAQQEMPELPEQVRERFLSMGLPVADTSILADDVKTKEYFDACVSAGANPKVACNWLVGDIAALLKEKKDSTIEDCKLTPSNLAKMIQLIENGTISGKIAKQILPDLLETGEDPQKTIEKKGLVQISDSGEIEELIQGIIDSNPKQLEQYRSGKTKLFGFFVGQVMKASKGRANPKLVNDVLKAKLEA
jgi:aspartyl-tRNA(Asn)/glutamyl-tRNA(Gln) amidotransferase subunit B